MVPADPIYYALVNLDLLVLRVNNLYVLLVLVRLNVQEQATVLVMEVLHCSVTL